MPLFLLLLTLLAGSFGSLNAQPLRIDTMLVMSPGDTNRFWVQIPENYNPAQTPALLSWWHGYGGNRLELLGANWCDSLNARGWIGACHTGGPTTHHYNVRMAQDHCKAMLDWIMERYPFSRDSVYMMGSSMGAAAPFIWHNNNCGSTLGYPLAAGAGGSPILDCELRQHQYIDSGHINNAMIENFGGIPDTSEAVDFEYHRYSAVHLADTAQSMHFNSLHLPSYARWGTTDSSWSAEWFAYGRPAQQWDTLRHNDGAETTFVACSGLATHGFFNCRVDSTLNWLGSFSCNRFPEHLSINADEDDEYYWTRVTLQDTAHVFGRYGVDRNFAERRLDINLVHNVAALEVEFVFPWAEFDTLRGHWVNRDSVTIPSVTIRLSHLPYPVTAVTRNGIPHPYTCADSTLTIEAPPSGDWAMSFSLDADPQKPPIPREIRLQSAYPNPFNSEFVLEISSNITVGETIELFDINGRLALSIKVNLNAGNQHVTVSADGLASGIYFVNLHGSSHQPLKVVLLK